MKIKILDNQGTLLYSVEVLQEGCLCLVFLPRSFEDTEKPCQHQSNVEPALISHRLAKEVAQDVESVLDKILRESLRKRSENDKQE